MSDYSKKENFLFLFFAYYEHFKKTNAMIDNEVLRMSFFDFHLKGRTNKEITPSQYISRLEDGEAIVLIDCRTVQEHQIKRIPESVVLPVQMFDQVDEWFPDRYQTYVIYCEHGVRSSKAVEIMVEKGYSNVYDLGGIVAWPGETESDLF